MRLAADRQVPTAAGRLWHGHPAVSVLGGGVISVILLLTGDIQTIVALGNVAAIAAMLLVNAAAVRAQRDRSAGGLPLPGRCSRSILGDGRRPNQSTIRSRRRCGNSGIDQSPVTWGAEPVGQ